MSVCNTAGQLYCAPALDATLYQNDTYTFQYNSKFGSLAKAKSVDIHLYNADSETLFQKLLKLPNNGEMNFTIDGNWFTNPPTSTAQYYPYMFYVVEAGQSNNIPASQGGQSYGPSFWAAQTQLIGGAPRISNSATSTGTARITASSADQSVTSMILPAATASATPAATVSQGPTVSQAHTGTATPDTTTSAYAGATSSKSLPSGAIAGIVIAVLSVVGAIGASLFVFLRRKPKDKVKLDSESESGLSPHRDAEKSLSGSRGVAPSDAAAGDPVKMDVPLMFVPDTAPPTPKMSLEIPQPPAVEQPQARIENSGSTPLMEDAVIAAAPAAAVIAANRLANSNNPPRSPNRAPKNNFPLPSPNLLPPRNPADPRSYRDMRGPGPGVPPPILGNFRDQSPRHPRHGGPPPGPPYDRNPGYGSGPPRFYNEQSRPNYLEDRPYSSGGLPPRGHGPPPRQGVPRPLTPGSGRPMTPQGGPPRPMTPQGPPRPRTPQNGYPRPRTPQGIPRPMTPQGRYAMGGQQPHHSQQRSLTGPPLGTDTVTRGGGAAPPTRKPLNTSPSLTMPISAPEPQVDLPSDSEDTPPPQKVEPIPASPVAAEKVADVVTRPTSVKSSAGQINRSSEASRDSQATVADVEMGTGFVKHEEIAKTPAVPPVSVPQVMTGTVLGDMGAGFVGKEEPKKEEKHLSVATSFAEAASRVASQVEPVSRISSSILEIDPTPPLVISKVKDENEKDVAVKEDGEHEVQQNRTSFAPVLPALEQGRPLSFGELS